MSARVVELAIFSFLLPLGAGGLWRAIRRERTWIAGAAIFTALCALTIVLTLRGHTLMGGGSYGVDHRRATETTTAADVALAVACLAGGTLVLWGLAALTRRRRHG